MAFSKTILPAVSFLTISGFAAYSIFGQLQQSELAKDLGDSCPATYISQEFTPYRLAYTGSPGLDHTLCGFITFFHALYTPGPPITFLNYFIGTAGPIFVFFAVEAVRRGRPSSIAYPVFFGLASQVITVGVTVPLYCSVFVLSGGAGVKRAAAFVTQAHAEAIAFSTLIGSVVPSAGLTILQDPYVTALWQIYPIYMSIAQLGHLVIRSPKSHSQSGFWIIRAIYITTFILASSTHIATALPLLMKDWQTFKAGFILSMTALSPQSPIESRVLQFLKQDYTFSYISILALGFWMLEDVSQAIKLAIWYLFSVPLLGPGAAFSGFALWRESTLRKGYEQAQRNEGKGKKVQ
ncbi:hypothetical protein AX16_008655 [Volvariella volvacea WC 439]|nr:hypothetical protein AX16_008655 [Volvariella volvacea WC 439]